MHEINICQICKEPINNYVNTVRLSADIGRWLPPSLSRRFAVFNKRFLETFGYRYDNGMDQHMVRSAGGKGGVCLYCYVNEIFQWLMDINKPVARRFRTIFSFGMHKSDFRTIIRSHAEPISEVVNVEDEFGLCDECGEYSDELKPLKGRWLCTECGTE